jgi:hypothetical protein
MCVRVSTGKEYKKNKIEQSKPDYKNKWILIFERAKQNQASEKNLQKSTEESIKVNERKLALTLTANLVEC